MAVAATLVIMLVIRQAGVAFVRNILFYYSVVGIVAYFLYNIVLLLATVFFFHRTLRTDRA